MYTTHQQCCIAIYIQTATLQIDRYLVQLNAKLAIPLNVEHELTRQRKWDKQETQEYMRHFNALKLDELTSDPRQPLMLFDEREGEKKNLQMFS